MTGASAAVRAIAAPKDDAEVHSPQEIHAPPKAPRSLDDRAAGRRLCKVTANRSPAATGSSPAARRGAPPRAGQFYMLAAEHHWEQGGQAPLLPRALSVAGPSDGD